MFLDHRYKTENAALKTSTRNTVSEDMNVIPQSVIMKMISFLRVNKINKFSNSTSKRNVFQITKLLLYDG